LRSISPSAQASSVSINDERQQENLISQADATSIQVSRASSSFMGLELDRNIDLPLYMSIMIVHQAGLPQANELTDAVV
jgi:hypothetical protein